MRFIAIFVAGCVFLPVLARTVQVPVELKNHSANDGRQIFVIGLPLLRGAVSKVENIRLSGADGSGIPAQFSVVDRWEDGSLRRVRVSGFIRLKRAEKRKIFVEYGSGVLHSVPGGILVARSNERVLIESGRLSAEFDATCFALPHRVMLNRHLCGKFLPFNDSREGASVFSVAESGALYTVIRMEKGSAQCRIYFFYDEPWIAVEWLSGETFTAKFSGSRNFRSRKNGGECGNWQIFRFDGKSADIPLPLIGVLPDWYYEMCGIIVAGGEQMAAIRNFENGIFQRIKAHGGKTFRLSLLIQSFLRTGDAGFIHAALKRCGAVSSADEAAWLQSFCSGYIAGKVPVAVPAVDLSSGVVAVSDLSRFLAEMKLAAPADREKFFAGCGILLRAFDPAAGKWLAAADVRGAPASQEYLQIAENIRCAHLMFRMEALTRDARFGDAGIRAVERILADGITGQLGATEGIFQLFDAVRAYFVRHPGLENNFRCDGVIDEFMINSNRNSRKMLKISAHPGWSFYVTSAERGIVTVDCGSSGEVCRLAVTDGAHRKRVQGFAGLKGLHRIEIPANGSVLKYTGGSSGVLRVMDWQKCTLEFPLDASTMHTFIPDVPVAFRFAVSAGCNEFTLLLRAMKRGETARAVLISPQGKRLRLSDTNIDGTGSVFAGTMRVADPEQGEWQLILHCSSGEAAVGISGCLSGLMK